mmetsp:Transcript_51460/g.120756  ORF Transcript_51460/g.120756 Transcript_51460/m.120756 type:complete len:225 (-) Transcript_51460:201-875(-)
MVSREHSALRPVSLTNTPFGISGTSLLSSPSALSPSPSSGAFLFLAASFSCRAAFFFNFSSLFTSSQSDLSLMVIVVPSNSTLSLAAALPASSSLANSTQQLPRSSFSAPSLRSRAMFTSPTSLVKNSLTASQRTSLGRPDTCTERVSVGSSVGRGSLRRIIVLSSLMTRAVDVDRASAIAGTSVLNFFTRLNRVSTSICTNPSLFFSASALRNLSLGMFESLK